MPIYAAASWGSLMSVQAASWIDPLRDVYEAFTIYTFLQLLLHLPVVLFMLWLFALTLEYRPPVFP